MTLDSIRRTSCSSVWSSVMRRPRPKTPAPPLHDTQLQGAHNWQTRRFLRWLVVWWTLPI